MTSPNATVSHDLPKTVVYFRNKQSSVVYSENKQSSVVHFRNKQPKYVQNELFLTVHFRNERSSIVNKPISSDIASKYQDFLPIKKDDKGFRYVNLLGEYDSKDEIVKSARFDIGCYGKRERVLNFTAPVTQNDAVEWIEDFLSEPLTQEYYEEIRTDTFYAYPWDIAKNLFKYRGDIMADAIFIEGISVDGDGQLSLLIDF
jgi:hypothetical protein